MSAWFYILRLKSGALYIGATTDLDQRYKDHSSGKACRTIKLDPPIKLVYSESYTSFSDARKREAQIKRWTRAKKEALVAGDTAKLKELSKSHKKGEFTLSEAEGSPCWEAKKIKGLADGGQSLFYFV